MITDEMVEAARLAQVAAASSGAGVRDAMRAALEAADKARERTRSAPDLYAALYAFVEFHDMPSEAKRPDVFSLLVTRARAALSRARGEQQ